MTMRDEKAIARARRLRRAATPAERELWNVLRRPPYARHKFRRQHPIGNYVADFASVSAKLVVEIDGGQHAFTSAWDEARTLALSRHGFRVVRFWNNQVLEQLEGVVAVLEAELTGR